MGRQVSKLRVGAKIGRWTLVELRGWLNGKVSLWDCVCECGTLRTLHSPSLYAGTSKSCGCLMVEEKSTKNGMSKKYPLLYARYRAMYQRCYNPENKRYSDYGGRGISICTHWLKSFENFLEDMGEPPFPGASLDRINNDGDYEPANCKWSDRKEQNRNTRKTRWVEFEGKMRRLQELAEEFKINVSSLTSRLGMYKMDLEAALTLPVSKGGAKVQMSKRGK
jgi:hypothetical protein